MVRKLTRKHFLLVVLFGFMTYSSYALHKKNENPEIVERMSRQLLDWHNSIPGREFIPESAGSFEYPWPGTEPSALP